MLHNSLFLLSETEWFGVLLRVNALRCTYKGQCWVAVRASEDGQIPIPEGAGADGAPDGAALVREPRGATPALRHRFFHAHDGVRPSCPSWTTCSSPRDNERKVFEKTRRACQERYSKDIDELNLRKRCSRAR